MPTYYVRKTGSDASAGTTPATAWLTIGKALGAAGIASGDTVYIGAGVYREVITVVVAPAATTSIIGDVTGFYTGDAGDVVITAFTTNDLTAPSATTLLNLNGSDYLTFQDIQFIGGTGAMVNSAGGHSANITWTRCLFHNHPLGTQIMTVIASANTALNWVIDSCIFIKAGTSNNISFNLTRPAGADYDVNVVIKNCLFLGTGVASINVTASGANAFNAGGFTIYNCTHFAVNVFVNTASANLSTTYPVKVYNCLMMNSSTLLTANTAGQIVEDWNILIGSATPRTNVTAGTHSNSSTNYAPMIYTGIENIQRGILRPYAMPKEGSPFLGYGNQSGSPSVDALNHTRPTGTVIIKPPYVNSDYGTATAGGAKTLTNTDKTWGTNSFAGYTVYIVSGTGLGQTKTIASNTATVLTVDGNWTTVPDNTSVYQIYLRQTASSGTATAGSTTTLTDGNAAWGVNSWAGYTLYITAGTGIGNTYIITSNTATVLTFPIGVALDNTSQYTLFRVTDTTTISPSVGAYEGNLDTPPIYPLKRMNRRKQIRHNIKGTLEN